MEWGEEGPQPVFEVIGADESGDGNVNYDEHDGDGASGPAGAPESAHDAAREGWLRLGRHLCSDQPDFRRLEEGDGWFWPY